MKIPNETLVNLQRCTMKRQSGIPHGRLGGTTWLWVPGKVIQKKSVQTIRLGGKGIYAPKKVKVAINRVKTCFRLSFPGFKPVDDEHFSVAVFWLRPGALTPKKSKIRSLTRGDPCSSHDLLVDALQGLLWKNDSQIVRLQVIEIGGCAEEGQFIVARTVFGADPWGADELNWIPFEF